MPNSSLQNGSPQTNEWRHGGYTLGLVLVLRSSLSQSLEVPCWSSRMHDAKSQHKTWLSKTKYEVSYE